MKQIKNEILQLEKQYLCMCSNYNFEVNELTFMKINPLIWTNVGSQIHLKKSGFNNETSP